MVELSEPSMISVTFAISLLLTFKAPLFLRIRKSSFSRSIHHFPESGLELLLLLLFLAIFNQFWNIFSTMTLTRFDELLFTASSEKVPLIYTMSCGILPITHVGVLKENPSAKKKEFSFLKLDICGVGLWVLVPRCFRC